MHGSSGMLSSDRVISEVSSSSVELDRRALLSMEGKADTPRFLITLDRGVGDTTLVGLSAVDQIIQSDPAAYGKIDILCTSLQSQIFEYDPRINRVIQTGKNFSAGPRVTEWFRGVFLDAEAAQIMHFLQNRHYEAVLPTIVAPVLYLRLHAHLMYPQIFKLAKNLLLHGSPSDIPMRKFVRQMVNGYFGNDIPTSELHDEILLYLDTQQLQKAVTVIEQMKKDSDACAEHARVLLVAADSGSIVTRPPTHLLAPALAEVLRESRNLIAAILPGYTDTMAAKDLALALGPEFAGRVFLLQDESTFTLLETAALIDQADIFVTGDTGARHLAVAAKRLWLDKATLFVPRNSVKIVAIFGGTNPDIWGYSERMLIAGKGRKEQRSFGPGYVKEMYHSRSKVLFDHISPQELAEVIISQL